MIRAKKGFTLVEMMIVLVIIGIIAAFAIPSMLESRTSANESGGEKSLRTLADQESVFYKTDYDGDGKDYCYDLAALRNTVDGNGQAINLIGADIAAGLKEGYIIGACATYNAAGDNDKRGYAYYAVPEVYKQTGRKTYVINSEGLFFYKDTGSKAVIGNWPDVTDGTWVAMGT